MSHVNVELVRHTFDSINEGDVDRALEAAADDFVMDWSNSVGPAKGIYRGKSRVRGFWASYLEAFELVRWTPLEFIEVDDSRLIVVNRLWLRGRGSGIEVDASGAQLWIFDGGVARSVKLYQSRAEALEAAGLRQ